MTTQTAATQNSALTRSIVKGIIGGVAGGVVFGIMMAMQNMLPMVGMLIGQDNAVMGFVVHMFISAFIGATYGVIAPRIPSGWAGALIGGALYGVVWWVLGALIAMPLMLGMNEMVLQVGDMQWMSLMGHAIFGVVMGAVYKLVAQRL